MILECSAIITVILVMAFMIMRSGRKAFAIGTLPLLLVPAVHMNSNAIGKILSSFLPLQPLTIKIGADLAALMVACILFGLFSGNFKDKKSRLLFLAMCGGFSAILACVLITSML